MAERYAAIFTLHGNIGLPVIGAESFGATIPVPGRAGQHVTGKMKEGGTAISAFREGCLLNAGRSINLSGDERLTVSDRGQSLFFGGLRERIKGGDVNVRQIDSRNGSVEISGIYTR